MSGLDKSIPEYSGGGNPEEPRRVSMSGSGLGSGS